MGYEIAVNWSINVTAINSYSYNSIIIKWYACPKMKSLLFRKRLLTLTFTGMSLIVATFYPG
jgi:hypothetical protein